MHPSICAFPSSFRLDPSPLRASISALPATAAPGAEPAAAPVREKLDLLNSVAVAPSSPARAAAGKENLPTEDHDGDAAAASLGLASDLVTLAKAASSVTSTLRAATRGSSASRRPRWTSRGWPKTLRRRRAHAWMAAVASTRMVAT
ncbi:hypothetical protein ACP4OV_009110 [Aristida adscensionis]